MKKPEGSQEFGTDKILWGGFVDGKCKYIAELLGNELKQLGEIPTELVTYRELRPDEYRLALNGEYRSIQL